MMLLVLVVCLALRLASPATVVDVEISRRGYPSYSAPIVTSSGGYYSYGESPTAYSSSRDFDRWSSPLLSSPSYSLYYPSSSAYYAVQPASQRLYYY
ncbi:hypothetical protein BV898_07488 [Hypsibius exemplaris]|uniref:Uncharacterized protein n=1 Tax=Hypsibius exemplaris TaxID=2072580 RepID=A0A1W0WTE5_HYPEX|nr:hypothetical protein BV898_07488 [Hypsibius exemplaris]